MHILQEINVHCQAIANIGPTTFIDMRKLKYTFNNFYILHV